MHEKRGKFCIFYCKSQKNRQKLDHSCPASAFLTRPYRLAVYAVGKSPPKVEENLQDTFSNPLSANMSEDDIRATIKDVAAGEEFMSREKVKEACEKLGIGAVLLTFGSLSRTFSTDFR